MAKSTTSTSRRDVKIAVIGQNPKGESIYAVVGYNSTGIPIYHVSSTDFDWISQRAEAYIVHALAATTTSTSTTRSTSTTTTSTSTTRSTSTSTTTTSSSTSTTTTSTTTTLALTWNNYLFAESRDGPTNDNTGILSFTEKTR